MARTVTFSGDERGVSEVVGYVLLIGMVLAATGVAVVMGAEAIDGLEAENDATSSRAILEDLDAELGTVASSSGAPTRTFDFSGTAGDDLSVQRDGELNVSMVSATGQRCSTNMTLGTIRFEEDSRVVAYEAGGIWERSPSGGSTMVSPPDVAFREGTLDVSVVNVSGNVNQGETEASFNQSMTRLRNEQHEDRLGECRSIDHVNITVESTFHQAWGEYLADQTGGELNTSASDQEIVQVELDSDELPRRVDMTNNSVVNLTESPDHAPYMENVNFGDDPRNITVDKDANNSYLVSVNSLTDRPPQIGDVQTLDLANVSNQTRGPVDVVFALDTSGSMSNDAEDYPSKMEAAREASKTAVGTLNTSEIGDRASVIGWTAYPEQEYIGPNGLYFSNASGDVNSTINSLSAGGSTDMSAGLNASMSALSYRDDRRPAHIFLMSDGDNQPGGKCDDYPTGGDCQDFFDQRTRNAAHIADSRGYVVHTYAFGEGLDSDSEQLLQDVADITGGNYTKAGSGDELADAFEETISGITRRDDYVTRTPVTTNMSSNNRTHPPQMAGDTDTVASVSSDNQTFLNINDPTAPTLFSHTFRTDDGEPVVINATKFECADDGWRDTGGSTDVAGTTYPVARCTDIVASNSSLEDDRIEHYLNGDNASSLMTNDDINESLQPYVNSSLVFTNLSSNQAIVNLNFTRDPTGELENNLVLLYEIGLSEEDATGADVINVRESTVTLD